MATQVLYGYVSVTSLLMWLKCSHYVFTSPISTIMITTLRIIPIAGKYKSRPECHFI